MANAGDTFTVELNQAQLEWGTFRFTGSRGLRYGEGYLKIQNPLPLICSYLMVTTQTDMIFLVKIFSCYLCRWTFYWYTSFRRLFQCWRSIC